VGGSISSRDQKQRRLQRKGKRANNSHSHAPRCRPHGRIGRATERNPRGTWTGDAIVGCSHSSTPRPATNRRANLSCKMREGGAARPRRGLRCGGYLALAGGGSHRPGTGAFRGLCEANVFRGAGPVSGQNTTDPMHKSGTTSQCDAPWVLLQVPPCERVRHRKSHPGSPGQLPGSAEPRLFFLAAFFFLFFFLWGRRRLCKPHVQGDPSANLAPTPAEDRQASGLARWCASCARPGISAHQIKWDGTSQPR